MKRKVVPAILVSAVLLTACSAAPSQGRTPDVAPAPAIAQPVPVLPVSNPAPPAKQEPEPPPPPAPVKPAVTWMPRGIGLPLVPSDPANEQKVAMLTFDDGPTEFTIPILETLAKENIKAVFFITGYSARKHPELVERIHKEGHILGVHTMTHPVLSQLSQDEQRKELVPLIDLIEKVTGQKPRYMRPPHGAYNDDLLQLNKELNLELINWSNGSRDWEDVVDGRKDPNRVVQDVMDQLHRGSVILFHDTMLHTVDALPEVIKQIRAEGYEFVTLP